MVIFTVLLASVTLPAWAAGNKIYKLSDYYTTHAVTGNDVVYAFTITTSPCLALRYGNTISDMGVPNGSWVEVKNSYNDNPSFYIYPLGAYVSNDSGDINAGLYIGDFVTDALVRLTNSITFRVRFDMTYVDEGNYTIPYTFATTYLFYDRDGHYITQKSSTSGGTVTYGNPGNGTPIVSDYIQPFSDVEIKVPRGAVYCTPYFWFSFENSDNGSPAYITAFQPFYNHFTVNVRENMFLKQSETMKAIEAELEETNDHLGNIEGELSDINTGIGSIYDQNETIINGTDEQAGHAQDVWEQIGEVDEDLDDHLSELEQFEELDTSTVFGSINDFLEADGWFDIRELLAPLLDWPYTATIMIFVIAFSTMRVLLLGGS